MEEFELWWTNSGFTKYKETAKAAWEASRNYSSNAALEEAVRKPSPNIRAIALEEAAKTCDRMIHRMGYGGEDCAAAIRSMV